MSVRTSRFLGVLCVVVLALQVSLAFRGAERMLGPPLSADSHHSFTIARSIAQGRGVDANEVPRAHGFQPLFTLTCAALFRIAGDDPIRALRLLLLLELVLHAATAALLAGIARVLYRDLATLDRDFETGSEVAFGWLVAFLYLVAVGTLLHHYDGLGTGLSLFLTVLAWRVYQRGAGETMANALVLGLVFGLAVLARADVAVFVAIVCVGELLRRDFERIDAVRRVAIIGAIVVSVSSPWWFYSLVVFGGLTPTSGAARPEFLLSAARMVRVVSAWLSDAVPWIYTRPGNSAFTDLVRLALLVPAIRGLPRRTRGEAWSVSTVFVERTRRFGGYLVVCSGVLAVWYCLSSSESSLYARELAVVAPCAVLTFAFGAWRFSRHSGAVAAALAVALVAVMGVVILALHQGRMFEKREFYVDGHASKQFDRTHGVPMNLKAALLPGEVHRRSRRDVVSRGATRERS